MLLEAALLVMKLLLTLVFAVAGVAKLVDSSGSRQTIIDFGLPASLANPLAMGLPLAELAVAAILLPTSTAWWGALGALALLSVHRGHHHQPGPWPRPPILLARPSLCPSRGAPRISCVRTTPPRVYPDRTGFTRAREGVLGRRHGKPIFSHLRPPDAHVQREVQVALSVGISPRLPQVVFDHVRGGPTVGLEVLQ